VAEGHGPNEAQQPLLNRKKGAKPFADKYRLNDKSEWTYKAFSLFIDSVEGFFNELNRERIFVI